MDKNKAESSRSNNKGKKKEVTEEELSQRRMREKELNARMNLLDLMKGHRVVIFAAGDNNSHAEAETVMRSYGVVPKVIHWKDLPQGDKVRLGLAKSTFGCSGPGIPLVCIGTTFYGNPMQVIHLNRTNQLRKMLVDAGARTDA